MGRAEEHLVEMHAVGADLRPDTVPVLLEDAFVVDAGDRHPAVAVVDDDRPGPERVEHGGGTAVAAVAATEVDPVPAAVGRRDRAVDPGDRAVLVGLPRVPTTVAVGVLVGLLERQQVRAGVGRGSRAACRVGDARTGCRRRDVHRRRAHAEGGAGAVALVSTTVPMSVVGAGGRRGERHDQRGHEEEQDGASDRLVPHLRQATDVGHRLPPAPPVAVVFRPPADLPVPRATAP